MCRQAVRTILCWVLALSLAAGAWGQQRPQYSQYFTNYLLLNPALAGTTNGLDLRLGARLQWVGFADAPRSIYGTLQGRVGRSGRAFYSKTQKEPVSFHGLGGQIQADVTGPTSRTSAYMSYAYNLAISKRVRMALGGQVGLQQFALNSDGLRYSAQGSAGQVLSFARTFPEAGVGLWMYSDRFFLGGSVLQLFRNQFIAEDARLGIYTARRHAFATAGYGLTVNKDWVLTPSVLLKWVAPAPFALDLNMKARYQDRFWAGLSYRYQDAVVAMAGLSLGQGFDASYSYDFAASALAGYQRGSHELTVGYRMQAARKLTYTDFWR